MIRVFHAPEWLMLQVAIANNETLLAKIGTHWSSYHCVAEVDTDNLDRAYRLTNSLDTSWWENAGVTFLGSAEHGQEGARSSSIGDVFELNGVRSVVARMGFEPLPSL
jgi:hypothetical protein